MQPNILGNKKVHGVKRCESPPVHLVHRETLNALCGKNLNWRWDFITLDLKGVLALSEDIYCLNCLKVLKAAPENARAA
jgi:hypothetical protein